MNKKLTIVNFVIKQYLNHFLEINLNHNWIYYS
jgi:hypothetical protein